MIGGYGLSGGYEFGGFFMIVWWVLIIIGIVMLVKWLLNSKGFHGGNKKLKKQGGLTFYISKYRCRL